ncbi:hypothetical protein R3P38DRAFT_3216502 [Favolaschia claudopus]|uniref:Uncharacterized protein n=1 Tax=Favolaschia claudopus TaxID=2862362 RepID=A0AAW0A7K2_9AGAR
MNFSYPLSQSRPRNFSLRWILWTLGGINFLILLVGIRRTWLRVHEPHDTVYLGQNDPLELPLHFEAVGMSLLRETTRFDMDLSSNISLKEWETLSVHPFVVHLGANRRAFTVAYYHQWHCVHVLSLTFLRGEYKRLTNEHVQHCLNYLRQSFLCLSDDSLEPGDFMSAHMNVFGGNVVCRNWEEVDFFVDRNLKDWMEWNKTNFAL